MRVFPAVSVSFSRHNRSICKDIPLNHSACQRVLAVAVRLPGAIFASSSFFLFLLSCFPLSFLSFPSVLFFVFSIVLFFIVSFSLLVSLFFLSSPVLLVAVFVQCGAASGCGGWCGRPKVSRSWHDESHERTDRTK